MEANDIKEKLRESVLLSAGFFILGKKKIEELIKSLEESGMTKEEAERTAQDALSSAQKYKDRLIKKIAFEFHDRNVFATKDDIHDIEKKLEEISDKLDEA